ncbi:hypothetical protein CC78DRAFT_574324 [Lojkania enalia]|uniref:Uncharacterized protein n=1 Tax=Lojkania enalia TaxID=147567 RepID=A0A9P4NBW5_9PLEO|nr:hypothetical protein CC78DRAFT_574324 [Didymosphaeria enalia]
MFESSKNLALARKELITKTLPNYLNHSRGQHNLQGLIGRADGNEEGYWHLKLVYAGVNKRKIMSAGDAAKIPPQCHNSLDQISPDNGLFSFSRASSGHQATMPSAVDIITYIGIPLAVLGVLPTIYTCLKSFFTLREITRTLHRNGVIAITRSALLSGIVEIEIPRRSIIPLDRSDPKYFALNVKPSSLKGGSWTLFNWKEMVIGVKSYRLQYHDELSQPQAEMEFEALIAFLLDRGAVPSKEGWADLRGAGLWTPAGTKLLLSPVSGEEVLSIAMSDDSDGILSLSLNWRREWDRRGKDSLPPYWTRVRPAKKEEDVLAKLEELEANSVQGQKNEVDKKGAFLDDDSAASDANLGFKTAARVRISAAGVQEAYREDVGNKLPLIHLRSMPSANDSVGFWFCCAATAFEAPHGGLWSYSIPEDVLALARRESVPCGVMVLLGAMSDDEVPTWRTPYNDQAERFEKHVKFMEQSRQANEEMRLPPEQRDTARRQRLEREARDFHNDFRRKLMKDQERKESETMEAMQSQKLPISVVAEANRKWLLRKFELPEHVTTLALFEQVLYGMIHEASFARRVVVMLDLWKNWSQSGGMTKSHYLAVKEDQVIFSLASFVIFVIRSTVSEPTGSVVGDLQECLRIWKKLTGDIWHKNVHPPKLSYLELLLTVELILIQLRRLLAECIDERTEVLDTLLDINRHAQTIFLSKLNRGSHIRTGADNCIFRILCAEIAFSNHLAGG